MLFLVYAVYNVYHVYSVINIGVKNSIMSIMSTMSINFLPWLYHGCTIGVKLIGVRHQFNIHPLNKNTLRLY